MLTDDLPAYQARKLYIFNCGHAITAYLGAIFHHKVISEAINNKDILAIVENAMRESGQALVKEYPQAFNKDDMEAYIQKTIGRYKNPDVVDDVTRVGRQPLRKLSQDERLLGPFLLAKKHGLPTKHIAIGIAAALMYRNDDDEQAVELKNVEEADGVGGAVEKILGMKNGSDEFKEITDAHNALEGRKKALRSREKN